jgi:hypothetical protein
LDDFILPSFRNPRREDSNEKQEGIELEKKVERLDQVKHTAIPSKKFFVKPRTGRNIIAQGKVALEGATAPWVIKNRRELL